MRKLILTVLMATGCASAPRYLDEPYHTQAQAGCLVPGFLATMLGAEMSVTATICECAEQRTVRLTGFTGAKHFADNDQAVNEENIRVFNETLNLSIKECSK